MKIRTILAALAATLLAAGCFQEVHEIDPAKKTGYVAPELQWANPDDAGTDIHDLLVVVNSPEGAFTKHYTNLRDFAREPLEIPAGEAGILVLANATEADGIRVSGLPPTKFTMAELLINVAIIEFLAGHPLLHDSMLRTGNCHVDVQKDLVYAPVIQLQDVMPSLTVTMTNIPEGTAVGVSVDNLARDVVMSPGADTQAEPGKERNGSVFLKTQTNQDNRLSCVVHPTVKDEKETSLTLTVNSSHSIRVYAPRIDCGKKYSVSLDFNELVPDMHLSSYTISDWEEGWTYNGRVY